jgi:hypothetical protein
MTLKTKEIFGMFTKLKEEEDGEPNPKKDIEEVVEDPAILESDWRALGFNPIEISMFEAGLVAGYKLAKEECYESSD